MKSNSLLFLVFLFMLVACSDKEEEEPAPDPTTFISATVGNENLNLINTELIDLDPFWVLQARNDGNTRSIVVTVPKGEVKTYTFPGLHLAGMDLNINDGKLKNYDLILGLLTITKNEDGKIVGTFDGTFQNEKDSDDKLTVIKGVINN